jgi:uncharacterized protein (DUF1501 family)
MHDHDRNAMDRRMFLGRSAGVLGGLGGIGLLASGATMPGFLARTAAAAAPASGPGSLDRRILVIVQLTGGNDGLNTVIPHRDDRYHRARPTLRVASRDVLRVTDDLGLHPALGGLHRLHADGRLGVVMNVGYPHPDRSHFRSMDIWHACTSGAEVGDTGWLGRLADREDRALAAWVNDDAPPLALRGRRVVAPSIGPLDQLPDGGDLDAIRAGAAGPRGGVDDDLEFVRRTAVAACAQAERLRRVRSELGGPAAGGTAYPDAPLGRRLQRVAALIAADFGPRVYYVTHDGFDTHARQDLSHAQLLQTLGDAVAAFQSDVDGRGIADRVMLMTFSEFGRRIAENGSRGTDHGAAAPMFVVGGGVQPGVHGGVPDLAAADAGGASMVAAGTDGDVPFTVDFRAVYAAMLEDWLGLDRAGVVPGAHAGLPIIG